MDRIRGGRNAATCALCGPDQQTRAPSCGSSATGDRRSGAANGAVDRATGTSVGASCCRPVAPLHRVRTGRPRIPAILTLDRVRAYSPPIQPWIWMCLRCGHGHICKMAQHRTIDPRIDPRYPRGASTVRPVLPGSGGRSLPTPPDDRQRVSRASRPTRRGPTRAPGLVGLL